MAKIEIDGKPFEAKDNQMIIEVADEVGIPIPRFCYHKKLSIAANCRMCLVEVEKMPKAVPACATPIADGMKVYTKSTKAIAAQKAVMEFLLINHPLDCPICDQGGECELQDISMGYGPDISRFTEGKRVVHDEDLGSLIATDMTRCIHCTRCVRFGEEVAGFRELGATGRGEKMRIGTYIKHNIQSEISGNIIDICPVGALTSKPFRFRARAWEMNQHSTIAGHDCLGSNIYVHTRRNEIMRVVPHENEDVNETWISDRDRFSYLGLNHPDRIETPMLKKEGKWQEIEWEEALEYAVKQLQKIIENDTPEQIAAIASPSSTLEECYLLQKLMRSLDVHNIDHRIKQSDFVDQAFSPVFYGSEIPYADLEKQDAILLVGSNLQREQPLAAVRVRKAALSGGKISALNVIDYDFHFDLSDKIISTPLQMAYQLASIIKSVSNYDVPRVVKQLLAEVEITETSQKIAQQLLDADQAVILLGAIAMNHQQAATIRSLAECLADVTGARIIYMTEGANSAGASLAGLLPHRLAGGERDSHPGLDVSLAFKAQLKAYILMGLEPELDCANGRQVLRALQQADLVIALSAYCNDQMREYADLILPIVPFTETSGTFVNVEGRWQTFKACTRPYAQARPGWKVLRVLANLFSVSGFDYVSTDEIREELNLLLAASKFSGPGWYQPRNLRVKSKAAIDHIGEWPVYAVDSIVRRSQALQESATSESIQCNMNQQLADKLQLMDQQQLIITQGKRAVKLPLKVNSRIADDSVVLAYGVHETIEVSDLFEPLQLQVHNSQRDLG